MSRLALVALVLGVLATASAAVTSALFTDRSENAGSAFSAGTVALQDDDAGSALFGLSGMDPGDAPETRCVVVTASGDLPAVVRLHGTTGGGGLDPYLRVKLTRGAMPPSSSCADFEPDLADHRGLGPGVVFDGSLQAYPDDWASGIADPGATWAPGEAHAFRFEISLVADPAARGRTATQTFSWEARST